MSNPLDEMRVQAQSLILEIDDLTALDNPTDGELERLDAATAEADAIRAQIEAAEARLVKAEERQRKVAELRTLVSKPGYTAGPTLVTTNRSDPYDLSEVRTLGVSHETVVREFASRAHEAIEMAPEFMSDDSRETAMRHVDNDRTGSIAKHYLDTGSEDYRDAWFGYVRSGEKRAALSTTGSNGGYFIPFQLDPTVILTNAGTVNPMRGISKVVTIGQNVWHGIASDGVTAEWTSEAQEVTDASPTFSQPTITPIRADAHVQASRELLEDTSSLASDITMLFADAKDRLEGTAFVAGTGSTQPWGLVTRLNVTTASKVAANTNGGFGAIDLFNLVNALPARYQQNCSWLAHWFIYNLARQFGGVNQPNFWVDLGPGIPSQLLGRSTYQSSAMTNASGAVGLSAATASTDNVLVLGDFSGFQIVDRVGMEVVYNPLVIGASALRPTGQVSWTAFWRVGSDCTNAKAFVMLQV